MSAKMLGLSKIGIRCLVIRPSSIKIADRLFSSSTSLQMAQNQQMQQVEVDEANVRQKLGDIQMAFVKKAETRNKERASRHVFYRKKDWMIGMTCITIAISIYAYTIFAMKQETFLDDFEMPDPLLEEERKDL